MSFKEAAKTGEQKLILQGKRWNCKEYKCSGTAETDQIRDNGKPSILLKNPMEKVNFTTVTEFIILGFPEFPELQIPLFFLFLLIYLIILMGNLTMITVTCLDSRLHTPMYFFLVMAYDRYVAICQPLCYHVIMNQKNPMEKVNFTTVTEFIILGFPEFPELQIPLFVLFLSIYLIILMGNLTIITITCLDSRLHTPMYFFLINLSFLDIFCTSVTLPMLLYILLENNHHISISGCFIQMYLYLSLNTNEFLILSVMAYDRYVAICQPLCYHLIMNQKVCILLSAGTWILGPLIPAFYFIFLPNLSFCGSNEINHFFCDFSALLKLSCSNTSALQSVVYILGTLLGFPCFISTVTSYVYIISNILRIRSTEGRRKAFSTCSSHLTVVCLFYLTLIFVYMRPRSMQSMSQNKIIFILHNTLIPMFNPVIYSMKNKDVKNALGKMFPILKRP
ncbi:olfactory receptor 151-like [Microcaecilia unicolor]|uniref:Olfactory receptor 151-like n=1 Tax=Microcaecilia unicolor TaxID=1415580 RepID=A0A6P7WPU0_9AMPH|nr:olfactory receptor 151-like [Microcaecilia unicolor]